MDLLVVPVYEFGRLADTLRFVLEDRLQKLQILLAEEPTELLPARTPGVSPLADDSPDGRVPSRGDAAPSAATRLLYLGERPSGGRWRNR